MKWLSIPPLVALTFSANLVATTALGQTEFRGKIGDTVAQLYMAVTKCATGTPALC